MTSAISFLRSAQASGDHWGTIVKAVLKALGPIPASANFGIAYVTEALAEDFSSIMTFLRETTPVKQWTIAVAAGLIGPLGTARSRPALAIMVAAFPDASFRLVDSWTEPARSRFLSDQRGWLLEQPMPVALIHGDSFEAELPAMAEDLAASTDSFLIGVVTPHQAGQLSGVLLGQPLQIVTGLTQGCVPLGGPYRVTEANDDVIVSLDGRPALDVMKDLLDPKMAQDLRQAAGIIHVGLPVAGADRPDYLVRPLIAIDPARGWIAIGHKFAIGDYLIFVKRDGSSARKDMQRMLTDIALRAQGRTIRGGIYISCVARGEQMFGSDDAEPSMILQSLGDFPLIGVIGHGEFCHDRLYGFTGVLALFLS
jgi:small ligand-binding sensory domain FIST